MRLARLQQGNEKARETRESKVRKKEKKGRKGFFKNLFKKKPKAADSTDVPAPPKEEFDFIDADTLTRADPPPAEPETKKGFFSPRKNRQEADAGTDPALAPDKKRRKTGSGEAEETETPADGF